MKQKQIFIAGNGPSLRDLDFSLLEGRDWLGMNAAYRYWDRVGIYPKIYCCLDKVVVRSHAEQILRLYREGRIERFFLVRDILDELPDFPQDDRVFFLEDMVASEVPEARIFHTAFPDKKTTGSWAVRFAIFLGYRDITLGGIDCSYVEVIKEAGSTGVGLELKIETEVASNPNYFFDDYQQRGDTYQVPNPERHYGNLHLQSFEALSFDIARMGLDVRIRNTSKQSRLHRFGVYEYQPLAEALGAPALQAVAVPLTERELPQLLVNLALWEEPAFRPLRPDSPLLGQVDLRLFFDGGHSQDIMDRVHEAWERLPALRSCFRRMEVTFLAIPEDLNHYVRDPRQRDIPRKMGPNLHFLATMRACRTYRFVQLMETDCVPAKADWVTDLDAICRARDPFWIAGASVPALGALDPRMAHHINGNALYATGDKGFQEFLDRTFLPALRHLLIERGDHDLAYDCLLERLVALKPEDDETTRAHAAEVQRHLGRFRSITAIANFSLAEADMQEEELLGLLESDHVLLHSRRLAGLLADAMATARQSPGADLGSELLARRLTDTFLKMPVGSIHAFHAYCNLPGCEIRRFDRTRGKLVVAIEPEAAADNQDHGLFVVFAVHSTLVGRRLRCRLTLESEEDQRVHVRFARQGQGPYVEDTADIDLPAGAPATAELSFECNHDYAQVRLLVAPRGPAGGRLYVAGEVSVVGEVVRPSAVVNSEGEDGKALFGDFRKPEPPVSQAALVPLAQSREHGLPRLLMVDSTPLGHASATGQLKKTYLEEWPDASFLQVWMDAQGLHLLRKHGGTPRANPTAHAVDAIVRQCLAFRPDVVYFRPVDAAQLFEVVEALLEKIEVPLVLHMMDDWPARLRNSDPAAGEALEGRLQRLVDASQVRIGISTAMAEAYSERYGGDWQVLANGADPSRYPALPKPARVEGQPFVIRYMGALADDMTYTSVCDVARVVSRLSARLPLRFEIHTMEWCRGKAEQDLGELPGVVISGLVPKDRYEAVLGSADALLIAYNFDEHSVAYIGYSLANKMPECLASGSPVLAYGPRGVATIDYLAEAGVAEIVPERNERQLEEALLRLATDPGQGLRLGERAREFVERELSLGTIQHRFRSAMRAAWALGPFPRESGAHFDETDCVSTLYDDHLQGSVMIDVGAHHGHATFPFVEKGWRVFAFEPDNDNRAILEKRLAEAGIGPETVLVDKRAVSNEARSGVTFFRSDQSTGISGLSAFHPTHESRQTVDITTLRDVLADKDVAGVDFLKIDTEGHDLFVLKGFPWERFSPAVIECEFEDAKTVPLGYTFHDMASYLCGKGYQVFVSEWHPIVRYGIRHDWRRLRRYPCELSDKAAWGNLLAFRDSIPETVVAEALGKQLSIKTDTRGIGEPAEFGAPAASPRYRPLVDPAFKQLSRSVWRYRHLPTGQRRLWMVLDDKPGDTAGRTFAGSVRLRSTAPVTVNVSIGRAGEGPYEGEARIVELVPGEFHDVHVCVNFRNNHRALKLQVFVAEAAPGSVADLVIDSVCIGEIPERLASSYAEGALDFRAANAMLRRGDVEGMAQVYRLLHARHPLRIYDDNAKMAAAGTREKMTQ